MGRGSANSAVKLYYRIGEVAGIVGVEPHVLRYWESEFPSIRPQKSRSGQRVYSRRDVDKLLRVKELLYTHRFTIAGARQRLREGGSDPGQPPTTEAESTQEAKEVSAPPASAEVTREADGLRSVARTLRATLLLAREDVCRMLKSFEPESPMCNAAEPAQAGGSSSEAAAGDALVTRGTRSTGAADKQG